MPTFIEFGTSRLRRKFFAARFLRDSFAKPNNLNTVTVIFICITELRVSYLCSYLCYVFIISNLHFANLKKTSIKNFNSDLLITLIHSFSIHLDSSDL